MMSEFQLREFTCRHCQHRVVVNPNRPSHWPLPDTCTLCWEKIDKPRHEQRGRELMCGLQEFFDFLQGKRDDMPLTKAMMERDRGTDGGQT
jgi:hypothetical protein